MAPYIATMIVLQDSLDDRECPPRMERRIGRSSLSGVARLSLFEGWPDPSGTAGPLELRVASRALPTDPWSLGFLYLRPFLEAIGWASADASRHGRQLHSCCQHVLLCALAILLTVGEAGTSKSNLPLLDLAVQVAYFQERLRQHQRATSVLLVIKVVLAGFVGGILPPAALSLAALDIPLRPEQL